MTCHLLILLMGKNFGSTQVSTGEYIRRYLEKRAKTVRYSLQDETACDEWLVSAEGLEGMDILFLVQVLLLYY